MIEAARSDSYTLLCKLLDAGADPNQTNDAGETALIVASQRGFAKCVQRLVEAGADSTKALNFAVHHGDWQIISMLLSGLDLSTHNGRIWANTVAAGFTRFMDRTCLSMEEPTELIQAIALGDNDLFDKLILDGVDINETTPSYCYCPLFVAVHAQNKYAYRRLMDLGAEDVPTRLYHTALTAAVYWNDFEIVKELLARGSDPKQYAQYGYCTLVYTAVRFGLVDMLKFLLSTGLHPDFDPEGQEIYPELYYGSAYTPLSAAILNGHVPVVELLLHAGADPNRLSNGVHPLHFAMPCYRYVESETVDYFALVDTYKRIINLMLAHGAQIDAKCLVKAYGTGQKEIAEHLVKQGAPTDIKDIRGKLPHEYAR
jgi:ankyrin repeat protein